VKKGGLKAAAKHLSRYQAADEYVVSWVVQRSLGGHAIPLDPPAQRALTRLGLIDEEQNDLEAARASLEHLVPQATGPLFGDLVSGLAGDVCAEDAPRCPGCPLASECPTGQEVVREAAAAGRRVKPR